MMNTLSIPTCGEVTRGQRVLMGWPEPCEFDAITSLRNAKRVRKWFIDDAVLDLERNRNWLARGMNRPWEALLSIRLSTSGVFLGFGGWSGWNPELGVVTIGRLAIAHDRIVVLRRSFPAGYCGVALDAAIATRDFAFREMQVQKILTSYIAENRHAERINRNLGRVPFGRSEIGRPDCRRLQMVDLELTRKRWEEIAATVE